MKKSTIWRAFLVPAAGFLLTGCEPSGQLLTGGVCACIAGCITAAAIAAFASKRSEKPELC